MKITITSRETIRPSLPSLDHLKPYKLCLFDQLTPMTYASGIVFYPFSDPTFNLFQTLLNLKKALSETLNLYYPFSGRTKNNVYIDSFDLGVPFYEAKVNIVMSEYLKTKETESLNLFLPMKPFCKEIDPLLVPPIAFQVSVFECGGIVIGVSLNHKVADGATASAFMKNWAALFSGNKEKVIPPNLSIASELFPPREDLPKNYIDLMDQFWFKKNNYVTRKFVFDSKAIEKLKDMAKSEKVPKPSRNEVLTCFIWKHAMRASWAITKSSKTSIVAQAVNIRPRSELGSMKNAVGNLFWWTTVLGSTSDEKEIELCKSVELLKESLTSFDKEYVKGMEGEDGFLAISEFMDQLDMMFSTESSEVDIYGYTNWGTFFNDLDFGWGNPSLVGALGKVGPEFRNIIIFVDTLWGKGIEAWITLEEKQIAFLETDSKFLAFASLNPITSSL